MDNHRQVTFKFSTCLPKQLNSSNAHLQKTECLADYTNSTDLERKKQESIKYIGDNPRMLIYTNKESIEITKFGDKSIKRESILYE